MQSRRPGCGKGGCPIQPSSVQEPRRQVERVKEVAQGAYREAGLFDNLAELLRVVAEKMSIMLVIVRPKLLPRRDRDDEPTNGGQRFEHGRDKLRRLLDVFNNVQQKNGGYPLGARKRRDPQSLRD
jgi:hypothetical protein